MRRILKLSTLLLTFCRSTIIDFIAYKYLTSTPGVLRAERIGAAFFYFDFKDSRKQTTLDMLGSLLSQLCQQLPEFPEEVANLYNTLPDTSRPPLLSKLQEILPKILLSFSDTFVLIDALDECTEIECLLKCISWLCHSSQAKFHIMTSSRSQPTIEEAMTALRFNTVSIQQQSVDADVGLYVTETIAGDKRLRVLDDTIKEQVTDVLIKGSHGMCVD